MAKKTNRSKSVKAQYLDTVISGLFADQLRSVASSLKVSVKSLSKSEMQDKILSSGRSISEILGFCHREELFQLHKHLYFARFSGKNSLPKVPSDYRAKSRSQIGIIRLVYVQELEGRLSYLFEHTVESHEMVRVEEGKNFFEEVAHKLRHTVSVHLDFERSIIKIGYSGYGQGRVGSNLKVLYVDVVSEILDIFRGMGLTITMVKIRESLVKLATASDRRVVVTRTHPKTARGEMDLRGYLNADASAADFLAELLEPFLNLPQATLSRAISDAINNAFSETEIATWKKEQCSTTITYWPIGAEFLFVWGGSKPTPTLINSLIDIILSVEVIANSERESATWEKIKLLRVDEIFTVAKAVHSWNISADECREVVEAAISAGVIEPVFRLRSASLLQSTPNEWTSSLKSFNKIFEDIHGTRIDGSDPSNIEIGFRKLQSASELASGT